MSDDTAEALDAFTRMFSAAGFAAQPEHAARRLKSEKRSAMSAKQRKRGATRTAQLNFRCSPEFKALVVGLAKHSDASIADVMEDAIAMLAEARKFTGSE